MLDVWHVDPARHQGWLLEHRDLVGRAERERGARFVSAAHASDYICSHAALRLILQRYGPATGEFFRSPSGKPRLRGAPHFSLSRTQGAVLVAVSDGEVGADIERSRPVNVTEPTVHLVAGAGTLSLLTAWTAMEAWSKWQGTGIAALLQSLKGSDVKNRGWWRDAEPYLTWADLKDGQYTASICSPVLERGRSFRLLPLE